MPNTSSVAASGNQDIDGLLAGMKWATSSLTYSFPTSAAAYGYSFNNEKTTFGVLSSTAQDVVRSVLAFYSSVANLTFAASSSSSNGDLRYAYKFTDSTGRKGEVEYDERGKRVHQP